MIHAYAGQDGAQLAVNEGEFVNVWVESTTEQGWVYAALLEAPGGDSRGGWLPSWALLQLPAHQRWMRVVETMEALHTMQLSVREGSVLKVHTNSCTEDGWIYAETADEYTGDKPPEGASNSAGWVPVLLLEWAEA